FADPAETKFAASHVALRVFAVFWSRAFCDYNDGPQITSSLARFDHARDLVVVEWNFRNQNDVCPAGDASVQGDPASVTTPRKTALSPGQSPPLVSTPIRGFILAIEGSTPKTFHELQHFL